MTHTDKYYEMSTLPRERGSEYGPISPKIEIPIPVIIFLISLFFGIVGGIINVITPIKDPTFIISGSMAIILSIVFTSLIDFAENKINERKLRKSEWSRTLLLSEIGKATEMPFLFLSMGSALAISYQITELIL